ncbi:MAG: hypothetical protein J6Y80_03690 [Victivallales bacterium]|nr:hypothetical protein [Victivallales bacterium]
MKLVSAHPIYREMLFDLRHRLTLSEEQYGSCADALLDALEKEEIAYKLLITNKLYDYSRNLRLIYADFRRLGLGGNVSFPAEMPSWLWHEPDGPAAFAATLDRLHGIAGALDRRLASELSGKEDTP